jgi:transposase
MTTKKKSYSKQFKIDAVKLVTEQGYKIAEAARNLDIHPNVLRNWRDQFKTDSDEAFPGKGHMTPEFLRSASMTFGIPIVACYFLRGRTSNISRRKWAIHPPR